MKRILSLLLAVSLVFGLSATAWAVETITVSGPSSVVSNGTITINVTVSGLDGSTYILECSNMAESKNISSDGSYSFTTSASGFSPGTSVTFIVTLRGSNTVSDSCSVLIEPLSNDTSMSKVEIKSGSTVIATANTTTRSITIPNSYTGSLSIVPTANNKAKSAVANPSSITLALTGQPYSFNVTVTAEDNSTYTHTYTITREAVALSTDTNMGTVTLKSGSTTVGSASGSTRTISVANAYSGSLSITATANDTKAQSVTLSQSSITLTTAGYSYSFTVTVKAESGATQTHTYSITRAAATTVNLISSGALRTGSASGTSIATLGAVTSASGTQTLSIPAANRSATSFYLTLSLPSGVSLSSVSGGTLSGGVVSISIPSNTTSQTVTLNFSNSYSSTITISRVTNANILSSVTVTYGTTAGSTVIGSLGAITGVSGGSTHTLSLSNTSYTSGNINWTLADGATLVSATWAGSSLSSGASKGLPSSGSTALVLTVNASNNTNYTATINVTKSGTVSNTLSSLYVKNNVTSSVSSSNLFDTSPSFSSGTTSYTVYVESDYDTIYIYPTPSNTGASVEVDGSYSSLTNKYTSNSYFQVKLKSSGTNKVNVKVTANSVTTTYVLNIEYEDDVVRNASLDSLKVSKSSSSTSSGNLYDLSPSFSYGRTKYEVDIPKSISTVYLHFEPYKSSATVTVSGATEDSNGVYKATLTTNKTKTVTIRVKYSNDTTTYTVNLNSGGSSSSYARLSRIRVASRESTSSSYQYTLLPSFDSSVTDYVALVPYISGSSSSTYAYVQATLDDSGDTLTVAGDEAEDGEWVEVSIRRGKSTSVKIEVEDDDGNDTTYKLTIVAAPSDGNDDATLDALSLRTSSSTSSAISLSPSFSKSTTSYTADNVANSADSLRVYATPYDSSAWVIVNDVLLDGDYATVELDEGKNTIKVQVYAEDCETSKTYTITVNRGAGGGSDSTLSNLEVRYGSATDQTLNLIPAFAKNTTTYRVNVDGSIAQVAFRATATDETAVIRIMGKEEKTGQWTSYNALSNDKNSFLITVTSGDGKNTSYYTVEVQRGLSVVVSAQKLKVNNTEVSCAAYNINGNNYFKLRDIAYALRGTPKSFDVTYNSTTRVVSMTSGRNYSIIGGEMIKPLAPGKYQLSNQSVMLDGRQINLTAYNVDGNNYFMLREIGALFNFGVDYDSYTSTMLVDSSKVYTPES